MGILVPIWSALEPKSGPHLVGICSIFRKFTFGNTGLDWLGVYSLFLTDIDIPNADTDTDYFYLPIPIISKLLIPII